MTTLIIAIIIIVLLVSVLGGLITRSSLGWYNTLNKPALTPPGWLISLVWFVIYVGVVISWYRMNDKMFLFVINMAFNIQWVLLFFGNKDPSAALLALPGLLITTGMLLYEAMSRYDLLSSIAMMIYMIWLLIVVYLNYYLIKLNR